MELKETIVGKPHILKQQCFTVILKHPDTEHDLIYLCGITNDNTDNIYADISYYSHGKKFLHSLPPDEVKRVDAIALDEMKKLIHATIQL